MSKKKIVASNLHNALAIFDRKYVVSLLKKQFGNGPTDADIAAFLDVIQPLYVGFMKDAVKRYKQAHDEQVAMQ